MADNKFAGTPLSKAFKTDKALEENGVWRDHESGICVKVRRSSRPEHKRALRKYYRPFQHLTHVDPKDELLIKQRAGAEELVADWGVRGKDGEILPLTDGEGNTIRPTQENVLEAFKDMPDFFNWVTEEADTFEHYRLGAVEDAGKNSSTGSDGTGNGVEASTSSPDVGTGESVSQPSSADPS